MRWQDTPVTAGIALVTLVVSALILLSGALPSLALGAGFVPLRLEGVALPAGLSIVAPVWLTPLAATLIHGGVFHVVFNLLMLLVAGSMLERAIGGPATAFVYVVGAYAAAAGQFAFDPQSAAPMIGASGATSAIIGAYALLYGQRRAKPVGPFSADVVHVAWLAAAWIGVQLLVGASGSGGITVAIGAHIGGFLAGLALARPALLWRYRRA
ncbi:MAG TPA: rhomboid family intramembrane serine protease [Sphingomonas sp.]|jgi:membrane associated rhomboid family serine protease|nr:rhomboid family intramembrane serine protease [Sphingomonas sp.]